MTTTSSIVIATGTREKLYFSDYTERYEVSTVTYWDGGSEWTEEGQTEEPVAIDTKTLAAVAAYRAITKWFRDRSWANRPDYMVEVGDRVEVFKGRKVPKGIYTVVRKGKGNYGPYFDLSGGHRFVSADNCRRVIDRESYDAFICKLTGECQNWLDYPTIKFATGLLALSDLLEDNGDDRAATVRAWGESCQRRAIAREQKYQQ